MLTKIHTKNGYVVFHSDMQRNNCPYLVFPATQVGNAAKAFLYDNEKAALDGIPTYKVAAQNGSFTVFEKTGGDFGPPFLVTHSSKPTHAGEWELTLRKAQLLAALRASQEAEAYQGRNTG